MGSSNCCSLLLLPHLLLLLHLQGSRSFLSSPTNVLRPRIMDKECYRTIQQQQESQRPILARLFAAANDRDAYFLDSDDPFRVLQINTPTSDSKEIRKAYRRMAVRFHPDVTTNKDSTAQEKRLANDRFAKINWAYQTLSGKNGASSSTASGSSSSSSSPSSSTGGWTPPHRRTQSYSSSYSSDKSPGTSTDWRDYIPNYRKETENYDTDGDSFGAIFSDLFQAAGSGVVGGGGILKDFVEFLEKEAGSSNFASSSAFSDFVGSSSYDSSSSNLDAELRVLLQTGSLEQIAEEMDDANLVAQQLETKLANLRQDVVSLTADLKAATGDYKNQMKYREELAAAQARIPVVENYLKQARKRLLALQTRYKEMIVRGGKDSKVNGDSVWDEIRKEARSSSSSSSRERTTTASRDTSSTKESGQSKSSDDKDDAWKSDSFGSFGRGRGSSRGRSRPRGQSSTRTSSSTSESKEPSSASSSSSFREPTQSQSPRPPPASPNPESQIPPHRRTSSSTRYDSDKRRLREIKVDEEFDKLKKELGL